MSQILRMPREVLYVVNSLQWGMLSSICSHKSKSSVKRLEWWADYIWRKDSKRAFSELGIKTFDPNFILRADRHLSRPVDESRAQRIMYFLTIFCGSPIVLASKIWNLSKGDREIPAALLFKTNIHESNSCGSPVNGCDILLNNCCLIRCKLAESWGTIGFVSALLQSGMMKKMNYD